MVGATHLTEDDMPDMTYRDPPRIRLKEAYQHDPLYEVWTNDNDPPREFECGGHGNPSALKSSGLTAIKLTDYFRNQPTS